VARELRAHKDNHAHCPGNALAGQLQLLGADVERHAERPRLHCDVRLWVPRGLRVGAPCLAHPRAPAPAYRITPCARKRNIGLEVTRAPGLFSSSLVCPTLRITRGKLMKKEAASIHDV
jgi:hypothetical protein